ncbi:hypothetical protein F5141DRAFT_1214046 [Pisolithus sp. B1]|nr:hypothetical protein F5141DRAFT_1214046 [Pisolithus sp. B1]
MFHSGLFNSPWHSWCSPIQLEDVQMVHQNDLFDDDMSSAGDPADHNTSTAALTQPQTQMDTSSSSAHTQVPAVALASFIHSNLTPYAAGQHEAPELEHQVNLIGVKMDDNGLNHRSALPEGCEEIGGEATFGTQDDQLNLPPVSAMVEAVTKSVKTALRTLLESGGHFSIGTIPWSPRQTPQWRRQENHKLQLEKAVEPNHHCDFILAEVCHLFKEKLGITQDIDFITHVSANASDVHAYKYKDGPSPDTDNVAFNLTWNHSSPWNSFILSFLLHELQACCAQEAWPIRKDDDYIEEVLHEHYKRLRTLWRNAQPKLMAKGLIEMPAEQEAQLVEENLILGKESRQATHCRNKYHQRKTVLNCIVTMKSEAPDDDLHSWQWLQHLINSLAS